MASIFRKIGTKKKAKSDVISHSQDVISQNSTSHEAPDIIVQDDPLPITHPVQTNSIFCGLHLSSEVVRGEAPDSPYMRRGEPYVEVEKEGERIPSGDENTDEGTSPFTFLAEVESVDSKNLISPDLEEEEEEKSTPGFSFLDSPVSTTIGPEDVSVNSKPSSQGQALSYNQDTGNSPQSVSSPVHTPAIGIPTNNQLVQSSNPKQVSEKIVKRSTGEKKKKRKAIRPGQGVSKEQVHIPSAESVPKWSSTSPISVHVNDDTSPSEDTPPSHVNDDLPPSHVNDDTSPSYVNDDTAPSHVNGDTPPSHANDDTPPSHVHNNIPSDSVDLVPPMDEKVEQEPSSTADCASIKSEEVEISMKSGPGNYTIQCSHEETLAGLLQSYASGLSRLRNDLVVIEESHRAKVLEQVETAQRQADWWFKDRSLREKEATALAEEDYELAEKLSRQLDATGAKPEQTIICAGLAEIWKWIQDCNSEKEDEVIFQKEMESKLDILRKEHNKVQEDLKREHASALAKFKMQMQSLENEVDREAGHVALDCSHLERREQLLEEETSRRAANFTGKKKQLTKELEDVELEINTLEEKLILLRNQKKDILLNISTEEDHIKAVEEELYEEREQLKSERTSFQERQDKLSVQQETVKEKQLTILNMEKKHQEETHILERLAEEATGVWKEVQYAVSLQCQGDCKKLLNLIQEGEELLRPSEELLQYQSTVEAKKSEVEEQTENILVGQNKLSQQRRTVRDLQSKLLELQESKKAAVTGRQFKEASRLSSESKTLNTLLEQEQKILTEAEQDMVLSSQKLAQLSDELCKVREEVSHLERKEDEAHIQDLVQAIDSLSGSFGENFSSVVTSWKELYILLTESFRSKHGLKEVVFTNTEQCEVETSACEPDNLLQGRRLIEIEAEIEKACLEEDYDRAAELEEELEAIKQESNSMAKIKTDNFNTP